MTYVQPNPSSKTVDEAIVLRLLSGVTHREGQCLAQGRAKFIVASNNESGRSFVGGSIRFASLSDGWVCSALVWGVYYVTPSGDHR